MTDYMIDCATKEEWAERALAAEARNKELALELLAVHTQAQEANDRLAKAEVIVRIIASDQWDERLGEAVDLSCEYLAELMGDDDDD